MSRTNFMSDAAWNAMAKLTIGDLVEVEAYVRTIVKEAVQRCADNHAELIADQKESA